MGDDIRQLIAERTLRLLGRYIRVFRHRSQEFKYTHKYNLVHGKDYERLTL